jgi:hypothetical protein
MRKPVPTTSPSFSTLAKAISPKCASGGLVKTAMQEHIVTRRITIVIKIHSIAISVAISDRH